VVTGPWGVGKGTLIRRLLEKVPGLELSVSATTRPPRAGERDGADYHFLSDEEFDRRLEAGDFMEHAAYSGHRYGTLLSEVMPRLERGTGVVLEIEVRGARQVRERMPEAALVFVAPPGPADLRRRLEGRGTDAPEQIERRLREAEEELRARGEFPHVIVM
jgi:guanylate kinase